MPKKNMVFVGCIALSLLMVFSCSRTDRTVEQAILPYDFVFVVNIGGQNEFQGDAVYNFSGGDIHSVELARTSAPDVVLWRVETPSRNGIPTPYCHDRLTPPSQDYWDGGSGYPVIGHLPDGHAIRGESNLPRYPGLIRTVAKERVLVTGTTYRATADRLILDPVTKLEIRREVSTRDFYYFY